jgi:hypothetical protein
LSKPIIKVIEESDRPLNVLIIAHKHSQLASVAAFLTRRGVPCSVKGNIREGINHIISQKVTFVFLSWNLPGANIIRTHQVLTQHFKAECIVFAERPDGKTAGEISNSKLPEIMQGPLSGPGLYLRLQKILKDKGELHKLDTPKREPQEEFTKPDKFINVGPANVKSDQPATMNFQEPEPIADPENDISRYLDQIQSETEATFVQEGMKKGSLHQAKETKPPAFGSVVHIHKKEPGKTIVVDNSPPPTKETLFLDYKPKKGSRSSESILAQKTFEALEKSVRQAIVGYTSVGVVSKAKVFNIHTPKFRGYLIFVVPMFFELDRRVVSEIRENLEVLLKKEKEHLLFFEEVNIEIAQKDFLTWAKENAEFFIQTVDHDTEIICAYHPCEDSLPKLEESNQKMSVIDIKDLKQNSTTSVNLYIHLPKNNKFVCYMKPGEVITKDHIQKFEKHKVQNLHIQNEDITPFKEYFVSHQVKDIIKKKRY